MQHSVNDTEKNTAACKTILEGFDSFATTLQKNLSSLHNGIAQQFEKTLSQMSSQKQLLTEIDENMLKTGVASTELGSRVKGLEKNLEVLTHEHRREQTMLEEAVTLLNTLVSKHSTKPILVRVTDSAIQTSPGLTVSAIQKSPELTDSTIQTSPGLTQTLFNEEQKSQPEDKWLTLSQIENSQGEVPPSQNQGSSFKVKSRPTAWRRKINKKRPLLPPQRKKGTICYENSQTYNINLQGVSSAHDPKGLVSMKPDPQLKSVVGLKPEPRSKRFINVKPDRQLNRLVNVKPAPQSKPHQQCRETRSNVGNGRFITPFNFWSEGSSSSPAVIETVLDKLPAETKAGISETPKGLWQLFDFGHSDPFSVDEE